MIKETFSKSTLATHLAEQSGLEARSVKAVLAALDPVILGSVHKKGIGEFTLPGLLKIGGQKVPPKLKLKPKRKGINPFTRQEQVFAAKLATVKLKVRSLQKLKDAAL